MNLISCQEKLHLLTTMMIQKLTIKKLWAVVLGITVINWIVKLKDFQINSSHVCQMNWNKNA